MLSNIERFNQLNEQVHIYTDLINTQTINGKQYSFECPNGLVDVTTLKNMIKIKFTSNVENINDIELITRIDSVEATLLLIDLKIK